jgi:hypothetical protein
MMYAALVETDFQKFKIVDLHCAIQECRALARSLCWQQFQVLCADALSFPSARSTRAPTTKRAFVASEQPVVDRKRKIQEESESFLLSDDRKDKLPVRDTDKDQILKRMNDMCSLVGSLQPPFGT